MKENQNYDALEHETAAREKKPGLVEKVKRIYHEEPTKFAVGLMVVSVVAFIAGAALQQL